VGPRAGLEALEKYLTLPVIELWENNISLDLEERGPEKVIYIDLAEDRYGLL
jgi:hypothetical protein